MNIFDTNQRGSILIYTLLTMSAMLAIGISMTGIFIGRLERSRGAQDSMIAMYAADSASERCLYEARKGVQQLFSLPSGASIVITSGVTPVTASCTSLSSGTFTFRAVGTYNGVSRALEIAQ